MKRRQFLIDLSDIPLSDLEISNITSDVQRAIAGSLKSIPSAAGAIGLQLQDLTKSDVDEIFRRGGSVPFGSVMRYLQPELLKISRR
jgi:hypothetical protein